MAVILDNYDWSRQSCASLYPWDEWLNGQTWQLTPGEDFSVAPSTIEQYARTGARARGGTCRVRHAEGKVIVQFYKC